MIDRTPRMTAAEYRNWINAQAPQAAPKFGNVRTGGSDSKREAKGLAAAEARAASGEIVGTSPQPSLVFGIDESGKYRRVRPDRMDVLEHFDDGSMRVRFVDVKGRKGRRAHGRHGTDTETSQAKRAAMRMMGVLIVVED